MWSLLKTNLFPLINQKSPSIELVLNEIPLQERRSYYCGLHGERVHIQHRIPLANILCCTVTVIFILHYRIGYSNSSECPFSSEFTLPLIMYCALRDTRVVIVFTFLYITFSITIVRWFVNVSMLLNIQFNCFYSSRN